MANLKTEGGYTFSLRNAQNPRQSSNLSYLPLIPFSTRFIPYIHHLHLRIHTQRLYTYAHMTFGLLLITEMFNIAIFQHI